MLQKSDIKRSKKTTFAGSTNNANEVSSKKRPTFSVSLAYKERWVRRASSCKNGHTNFYVKSPSFNHVCPRFRIFFISLALLEVGRSVVNMEKPCLRWVITVSIHFFKRECYCQHGNLT